MFILRYSEEKNRIYIELHNVLSQAEFEAYKSNIIAIIDNSKMGFTVLADLSTCDKSILDRSDSFNVIREYGVKRGFKANALVLGRESYDIYNRNIQGSNKHIFLTIEEAENYLNAL
ncbi:MAG: hypothetical protein K0S75_1950 [Clostridia bacterium]|jgi:hypothetical protein|nr:hypothetical protein [Clostridia bacterium]